MQGGVRGAPVLHRGGAQGMPRPQGCGTGCGTPRATPPCRAQGSTGFYLGLDRIFIWLRNKNPVESPGGRPRPRLGTRQDFYFAGCEIKILSSLLAGRGCPEILEHQRGLPLLVFSWLSPGRRPRNKNPVESSGRLGPRNKNPVESPGGRPGPRRGLDWIFIWRKILSTGFFARTLDPWHKEY